MADLCAEAGARDIASAGGAIVVAGDERDGARPKTDDVRRPSEARAGTPLSLGRTADRFRAELTDAVAQLDLALAIVGSRPVDSQSGAEFLGRAGRALDRIVTDIKDVTVAVADFAASREPIGEDLAVRRTTMAQTAVVRRDPAPMTQAGESFAGDDANHPPIGVADRAPPLGPDLRFDDLRRALRDATPGRIRAVWPPPTRASGGRAALKVVGPNAEGEPTPERKDA